MRLWYEAIVASRHGIRRDALLLVVGVIAGVLIGWLVVPPGATHAAEQNEYKVEMVDVVWKAPGAMERQFNKRAGEGWMLQAMDGDMLVFRRAAVPALTPPPAK